MSGFETAVSVVTLLDVIFKLVKLSSNVRGARKELDKYITELNHLNILHGSIKEATSNLGSLLHFTFNYEGRQKNILDFCGEQLEKIISEARCTIEDMYALNSVSRIKRKFGLLRFALGKDAVRGLRASVKHTKSALKIALAAATLYQKERYLRELKASMENMAKVTTRNQRSIGHETNTLIKKSFHEQLQKLQDSLDKCESRMVAKVHALKLERADNVEMRNISSTTTRKPSPNRFQPRHAAGPASYIDYRGRTPVESSRRSMRVTRRTSSRASESDYHSGPGHYIPRTSSNKSQNYAAHHYPHEKHSKMTSVKEFYSSPSDPYTSNCDSGSTANASSTWAQPQPQPSKPQTRPPPSATTEPSSTTSTATKNEPTGRARNVSISRNLDLSKCRRFPQSNVYQFCLSHLSLGSTSEILHLTTPCLNERSCNHTVVRVPVPKKPWNISSVNTNINIDVDVEAVMQNRKKKCCGHTTLTADDDQTWCVWERRQLDGLLKPKGPESNERSSWWENADEVG